MTERLSQETLQKVYDAGQHGLVQAPFQERGLSKELDLDAILAAPQPRRAVQRIAPQALYFALKDRGLGDSLELLSLISSEQFVRLCDYDVWDEDELVPRQLFAWLAHYREISPRQMYQRFRQLDEEYQLAALAPYVRIFTPDDFENLSHDEQDRLYAFPQEALYYSVSSPDEEVHRGIEQLLEAAMGEDMAYAMSLVTHAAYAAPGESEFDLARFRRARLEEDGFVAYEESLTLFQPASFAALQEKWRELFDAAAPADRSLLARTRARASNESERGFLGEVLDYGASQLWTPEEVEALRRGLLYLANSLCAATKVEPGDREGLRRVLDHSYKLCGFSLEALSGGDLARAAMVLRQEYPKQLFQAALGWVEELRLALLASFRQLGLEAAERLERNYRARKFGAVLSGIDRELLPLLGFETCELLKAFFNRFPLYPRSLDESQGEAGRMVFAPLEYRTDLRQLVVKLETLVAKLVLAALPSGRRAQTPDQLDRSLATALARLALGESRFEPRPLTQADIERLCLLAASPVEAVAGAQELSPSFQSALAAWCEGEPQLGRLWAEWQRFNGADTAGTTGQQSLTAELLAEFGSLLERVQQAARYGSDALAAMVYTSAMDYISEEGTKH